MIKRKHIKNRMKSVSAIRDEYFDEDRISPESMNDLIWHIENDPDPSSAISLVTDARLHKLVPLIDKYFDHEDWYVREFIVSCLVRRWGLAQYAERALQMAKDDPDSGPRVLATSSLGAVINQTEPDLRLKIGDYLYRIIRNHKYDKHIKRCAFDSILEAMGLSSPERDKIPYDENHELVKKFKERYGVWNA